MKSYTAGLRHKKARPLSLVVEDSLALLPPLPSLGKLQEETRLQPQCGQGDAQEVSKAL